MNTSLRDLGKRVETVTAPQLDAAGLVAAGESRIRRRRLAAVAAATAAAVAVVGGALLASPGDRNAAPDVPPADHKQTVPDDRSRGHDQVETRLAQRRLSYAVGTTIHWGNRTIDVGQTVQAVGVTDDGVVFVRGDKACPYEVACRTLWFTDGAEPVRIGTVTGSWIRGFGIAFASAGSTVVWSEPDPQDRTPYYPRTGEYVAYDTSLRREVGRFGSERSMLVAVGDDTVYWVPDERQCVDFYGECLRFKGSVMRFDVATGGQASVSWESYWATRSSWPRTLMSPQLEEIGDPETVVRPPHADPKLNDSFAFRLDGTRLVGDDGSVDVTVRLARTGAPLRLRMPAGYPSDGFYAISQWLDDDHVVMNDGDGSLLVCRVPSGRCRTTVKDAGITGFGGRG
jgi:hypothetical protein